MAKKKQAEAPEEKKPVGCPPYYTEKDLPLVQQMIDDYFAQCEGELLIDEEGDVVLDKYGYPIYKRPRPPTITGLALALGFTSRQSLLNYQAKGEFVDTITRAKSRCEEYTEGRLYDRDGQRGAQFSLEVNFNWRKPKDDESGGNDKEGGIIYLPEVGP